ncbi:MAG TPA: S41 family peptidase [Opitutaceae bacterium]
MRANSCVALLITSIAALATSLIAQDTPKFGNNEISNARGMLRLARDEVLDKFYDPKRLDAGFADRCAAAEKDLARARSNGEAFLIIAQAFLDVGDSHTLFMPPGRRDLVEHQWEFDAIGDAVYVSRVEKGSDAETKGLRVGDRVLAIDGIEPRPADLFRIEYLLYALVPRPGMRVIVQAPGQNPRQLDIAAKVTRRPNVRNLTPESGGIYDLIRESEKNDEKRRSLFASLPGGILVWRLNRFDERKVFAGLTRIDNAKAVVLDLRGNPGGTVYSCQDALAGFLKGKTHLLTEVRRNGRKEMSISGKGSFNGPLFVLIGRGSASGSELFVRTIQLRERGRLIGERTRGHLSIGNRVPLALGSAEKFVHFGVGVTIAGVEMPDGSFIERVGVTPDETVIPTHEDLYLGRDPALARAITLAGHPISAEEAGKLIPVVN